MDMTFRADLVDTHGSGLSVKTKREGCLCNVCEKISVRSHDENWFLRFSFLARPTDTP